MISLETIKEKDLSLIAKWETNQSIKKYILRNLIVNVQLIIIEH